MEETMKIDGAKVRTLREARAWSQEQLASVAGLSTRTVQRVEADGTAASETRMALASALECRPEDLLPPQDAPTPGKTKRSSAGIAIAITWAAAIVGAAILRAPDTLTLVLLPALGFVSLVVVDGTRERRCALTRA